MPKIDKNALKESVTDSIVGMPIAVMMNWVLLYIGIQLNLGATGLTVLITSVMFLVAVIRKYAIRTHFKKRFEEETM